MPRLPQALLRTCVFACALMQCASAQQAEEHGERDNAAARAEYQRSGRTAKGENAADLLHRAYQQKMVLREMLRLKRADAARALSSVTAKLGSSGALDFPSLIWQSMGPSPVVYDPTAFSAYDNVTGRVTALAVDQSDPSGNTVYLGAASGGVWKSTNAAADPNAVTWTPLTDDQASLAVGAIALQPGGNVLLVGTGETNSSPDSYYGQGILRSTDGGHTWTLISSSDGNTRSFHGLGFSRIAFSTADNRLVVAATAATNAADPSGNGGDIQGVNGQGIYYSTDAGLTWTYASAGDPSGAVDPGSVSDVVYDATHSKFYAAIRTHGYYSSVDGAVWTRLASQPGTINSSGLCSASPVNISCPMYRGSLSVNENTGEVFTIFVDSSGQSAAGDGGIFVLPSSGASWTQLAQSGIDGCGDPGANAGCGTQQGSYNLYIQALPNGANTDLYVGAVNIFKCSRTPANPACSAPGSWLNLTHVYGCAPHLGGMSGVHPDQHAIDFSRSSHPTHIYFGNDGGVWRALDETALVSSSCSSSNPFQNLNGTLGSLSEFVSFAQHPTDAGIILGGLQDNGSPALVPGKAGVSGLLWQGLNDSDGGYNAIDANVPSTFYTSYSGVSVQRCVAGTSCDRSSWTTVMGPNQVSGDGSAFYPPWMLDPQDHSRLVIGTCRLWRGTATGGPYSPLSWNFSTGDATQCAGTTQSGDSKVRSIAMGGPTGGNGSKVVYAGLVGSPPLNGHVFVTTNVDNGPVSWIDRTGNINPSGYDVSDIAISPFDASGQTAYLTIMGFGTAHVFKTTDGGTSWTDSSGNLPDVPANSIAIDPQISGTVYVGTDGGVFVTTDDGLTWAELGTALPNAPVVKLKIFDSSGVKRLRAATYGRGLWQVDLTPPGIDFSGGAMTFAAVVGRSSAAKTVAIVNHSTAPISLNSVSATDEFPATNNCPATLTGGASCTVSVIFTPTSAGTRTVNLILTSSIGTKTLPFTGNAVDFSLSAIGPRPTRGSRTLGGHSVVSIARGQSVVVDLAVSILNAQFLDRLEASQRELDVRCFAMASVRCSLNKAKFTIGDDHIIHISISSSVSRSRRLSGAEGLQMVEVVATVGAASHSAAIYVESR